MSLWQRLLGGRARPTPSRSTPATRALSPSDEAANWAERLRSAGEWEELAAIFNSTDYSDAANKWKRRDVARLVLGKAGRQCQDGVLRQFSMNGVGQHELAEILASVGDQASVEPLVRCFPKFGPYGGCQSIVLHFLARFPSLETARGMEQYLTDEYSPTRVHAAQCLGLLGYPESLPALVKALDKDSSSIRSGLQAAGTDFAKALITKWEEKRRATQPTASLMSDSEMLKVLRSLCDAYSQNDRSQVESLEITATEIGQELNRRGGKNEMLRLFKMLDARPGLRTLEMHWDGIGDWMG